MKRHLSARHRAALAPLTEAKAAATMKGVLPRRNNYSPTNYRELLEEAAHFEIRTPKALRKLLLKHRRTVVGLDRGPFDSRSAAAMRAELGDEVFAEHSRRQTFWTWEGLFRLAMGCEFGKAYENYRRHVLTPNKSLERTRER